jgi:hypothetical protein
LLSLKAQANTDTSGIHSMELKVAVEVVELVKGEVEGDP